MNHHLDPSSGALVPPLWETTMNALPCSQRESIEMLVTEWLAAVGARKELKPNDRNAKCSDPSECQDCAD